MMLNSKILGDIESCLTDPKTQLSMFEKEKKKFLEENILLQQTEGILD